MLCLPCTLPFTDLPGMTQFILSRTTRVWGQAESPPELPAWIEIRTSPLWLLAGLIAVYITFRLRVSRHVLHAGIIVARTVEGWRLEYEEISLTAVTHDFGFSKPKKNQYNTPISATGYID